MRLRNHDGRRIFNANLVQDRAIYQFGSRPFLQLIAQVTDVDYNPRMYTALNTGDRPKPYDEADLFLQILGSYEVNPQTVAYVGYSDQRTEPHPPDLRPVDRTFFLKLGYAWAI